MIEQSIDFDPCLSLSESGPGEQAQAKGNRGSVQGEELVLELEFMLGSHALAAAVDATEEGFVKRRRPFVVGLGKGRSGRRCGSEMIQVAQPRTHRPNPVPKRFASGQLDGHQVNKLVPTGELTGCPSGSMRLVQGAENMSRNDFEHLGEDRATISHGLI